MFSCTNEENLGYEVHSLRGLVARRNELVIGGSYLSGWLGALEIYTPEMRQEYFQMQ